MTIRQERFRATLKILTIIGTIATVALLIYAFKEKLFLSNEKLGNLISKVGVWGPLIFILLQIFQVVIPIMPGGVSCVAGVVIFGPLYGFIYNYIGISIGSTIGFLIARKYGKPFIQSVVSDKTYKKYIGWLDKGKRFDKLFATAIFMPVAPDDLLCLLAGLTEMKLNKFVTIILLCKPISIFIYSEGLTKIIGWLNGLTM